ncbi:MULTISPECIES: heavy-metal-associated domain-containing protein [unclassified Arthrobacter]|uniref:heavy-metal-associated domain-containing protein n=1 Tax=unclassified Arthrobacter TaxID=235627 RepID=UPI001CFFAF33|nr:MULTISPECIES: heavy-metal-associated domain-containing protein [unclassified Arthrobacter]MCB5283342.1 Copper chaperone CopZ [Arthrobacter sp. ES1]WGZ80696.1 heavy-metal-associated domain-containing protein [Arthrobacter sp. EM1]
MSVTTTVNISGMDCSHCVVSVTEELHELDGVQEVTVELNKDGISVATITSAGELDSKQISEAVAEAGYAVAAAGV